MTRSSGCLSLLLCGLALTHPAFSQANIELAPAPETSHRSSTKAFVRDIWKDQQVIWTSPFRMNMRQWLTIGLPIAGVTAALIATDRHADTTLPNTADQVRWSGRVSQVGSALTLSSITAGTLLLGRKTGNPSTVNVGRQAARALADSAILTFVLKSTLGRERPMDGTGNVRFFQGGNAFPSGHALMSFAVATAIARHSRTPRWVALASYAAATAITLSRYGARRHSPSDLFVGATFGILVGNYVSRREP
jgi:membrane-associated phospholipid phosphatase